MDIRRRLGCSWEQVPFHKTLIFPCQYCEVNALRTLSPAHLPQKIYNYFRTVVERRHRQVENLSEQGRTHIFLKWGEGAEPNSIHI